MASQLPVFTIPVQFQDPMVLPSISLNANFLALLNAVNTIATTVNGLGGGGGSAAAFPNVINAAAAPYSFGAAGNSPTQNTNALQTIVTAAITAGSGAWIILPAGTFQMAGPVSISNVNGGMIIQGSSAGTVLIQTQAGDMFDCSANSHNNQNGIRFRDITFQYQQGVTVGTAISAANGGSATTAECCTFTNTQSAFSCGTDGRALACGLVDCYVNYQLGPGGNTLVTLSGAQGFIINTIVQQKPIHNGGPAGVIGVSVNGSASNNYISDCQISDVTTGIQILAGPDFTYISGNDVSVFSQALVVQPATNAGKIYGVFCTANNFRQSPFGTTNLPLIFVDTNGGSSGNVSSVFLTGNLIADSQGPGVELKICSNVTITGGQISGNGYSAADTLHGANVVISNAVSDVLLSGVDMSGIFQFTSNQAPYALAIQNSPLPTGLYVIGCNMTTTATGAVYTAGATAAWVIDCPGYNDKATKVTYSAVTATPVNAQGLNYYGPVSIYFSGGTITHVRIGGVGTPGGGTDLGSSPTYLHVPKPNTFFEFDFTGGPTFNVIGE